MNEFSVSDPGDEKAKRRSSFGKGMAAGVFIMLVIAAIVFVVLYFTVFSKGETTDAAAVKDDSQPVVRTCNERGLRVDCLPEMNVKTESDCNKRLSCTWDPHAELDKCVKCYVDFGESGFRLASVEKTSTGQLLRLQWFGDNKSVYDSTLFINAGVYIDYLHEDYVRIKFVDLNESRYEVPVPLSLPNSRTTKFTSYSVKWSGPNEKFYIKVFRVSDQTVIFDSSVADLILEDQFLSLSTRAPSANVYGFGENQHRTFRYQFTESETWPLFARDQPPKDGRFNLYGVHPFYTCIEESGNAHGVFLFNSNAQDYTLTPDKVITYRTIGGILDFYIFTGPTPENVIQEYTSVIGRPYMPPYWSLGFQICRYGYHNTSEIRQVVERTRDAGIPHDVQYADIDYMDARKDFTIDLYNFGDMPQYFEDLRDPALSIQEGYHIYPEGRDANIYVKWPNDTNYDICFECTDDNMTMLGYVWPDNKTAFPDFFKTSTKTMWSKWITEQSAELEFDGLWIDMNEPANFDTNKVRPWNWPDQRPGEADWNLKCDMNNKYENPPYKTKAAYVWNEGNGIFGNISDKTLCMVGTQGENEEFMHYDVHNLYGWSQSEPTLSALRSVTQKRGIVISRSTFPGSGVHVGHWLGDNTAHWSQLRDSVIGMLEFNMFGIPYVGADICGFFEDSNAQLCKRWMQLGAFYPFSRNHNGIDWVDHDPAAFDDPSVAQLSKSSLETRYTLLPYLYTLFYEAHTTGSTVVRPLQFEWPSDRETWDISEQFLWGSSILFSPIMYENQTSLRFYLPAGRWYDYYSNMKTDGSQWVTQTVHSLSEIPIHIRGGKILPTKKSALTTAESRLTSFSLLVALDDGAEGNLFWDDGEEIGNITSCVFALTASNDTLSFVKTFGDDDECGGDGVEPLQVDQITFLGLTNSPSYVNRHLTNGTMINEISNSSYNSTSESLVVSLGTEATLLNTHKIMWG